MNFAISSADIKEIDEIKAINEACLAENYERSVFEQLCKSTLICRERGKEKIAGYVIMANLETLDKDLIPFSRKNKDKYMHTIVFSLAVLPEYRLKGIATKLLRVACESHKQHPIFLHSRKSNEAARKLYSKFDFKVAKEVPDYYKNPTEDGLIMIRLKGAKNKHLEKLIPMKPTEP
jgi:ribosomal-protein-alanine N-acetyltransferase